MQLSAHQQACLSEMEITQWQHKETPSLLPVTETIPDANNDWQALQQKVTQCTNCGLSNLRNETVLGYGNDTANWLIIGDLPKQSNNQLSCRADLLLHAMLNAIGLDPQQIYITTALKCSLSETHKAQADEINACQSFLHQQIALLQPQVIICLGESAASSVLQLEHNFDVLRGQIHPYKHSNIPVLITHHPIDLLREPKQKLIAWQDLCLAKKTIITPS